MSNLTSLGLTPELTTSFQALALPENAFPSRIINQHRRNYLVQSESGELSVSLPTRLAKRLTAEGGSEELPVVGDWVAVVTDPDDLVRQIVAVLPRRNKLSRKVAGKESREQVIAANLDRILIVTAVGDEFNPRRLERYLAIAHDVGVLIVIVLNKLDDAKAGLEQYLKDIHKIAPDIQIMAISAMTGAGLEALEALFQPAETVVLIGSSGVGKSTLINSLLGYERQTVREVRSHDAHGRHETTSRELIVMPNGAMVIDNPGLREIQLWIEGDGLTKTFQQIEDLSSSCRFKDCQHQSEPGCAVMQAVSTGELDEDRLESYHKLLRELEMSDTRFRAMECKRKGRMYATYRKQVQERRNRGEKA